MARDLKFPAAGGCRCGQVRLKISAPPLITAACHCPGCQRMSSSAYSLTVMIPADGFEVTEGELVIGGLHGDDIHHFYCPRCMSWMFTRIAGAGERVNVRPTMLDDSSWFTPFIETYTSEKLPWVEVPALHSFEKFPVMEDFGSLVADYAKQADRSG